MSIKKFSIQKYKKKCHIVEKMNMGTTSKHQEQEGIAYICGKCHGEISKNDETCPHCGVKLGKIKCPYCGFTGDADDFKNDRCPKCGKHRTLSVPVNIDKPHYYRTSPKKTHLTNPPTRYHSYKVGCIVMSIAFVVSVIVFLKYFNIM